MYMYIVLPSGSTGGYRYLRYLPLHVLVPDVVYTSLLEYLGTLPELSRLPVVDYHIDQNVDV